MIDRVIRIKNKYLVIIILGVLLSAGLCLVFGPAYFMAQARAAGADGDQARALAMYDRVIGLFPWNTAQAGDALYWSAQLLPRGEAFEAYLFGNQSGFHGSLDDVEETDAHIRSRIERLQLLLEKYPDNRMARWHAPYMLGAELMRDGRTDEAVPLLERALNDPESRQVPAAAEELCAYYMRAGQYTEAVRVAETSLERSPLSLAPEMHLKRAEAYLEMGEYDRAEQAFRQVLAALEEEQRRVTERGTNDQAPPRDVNDKYWYLTAAVERGLEEAAAAGREDDIEHDTVVRGAVRRGGVPLAGIHVMLVPTDQGYGMVIPPPPDLYDETRSGADGGFTFVNVAPGSYQVGLRLSAADARELEGEHLLVKGGSFYLDAGASVEVEFNFAPPVTLARMEGNPDTGLTVEWAPYPGADSYNVMLGALFEGDTGTSGSTTLVCRDYARTTITLEPMDFYDYYGVSSDMEGILPPAIAGVLAGGDEVWLDIQALDREGRVLSSLRGLRFTGRSDVPGFIDRSGVQRSTGDELLRERRYAEAVAAYEADLAADPEDIHALVCLFQLYRYGTKPDSVGENPLQDLKKAVEYGERLVAITGDQRLKTIVEDLSEKEF